MTKLQELTVKLPQEWVEHLEQLEKKTKKKRFLYQRNHYFVTWKI